MAQEKENDTEYIREVLLNAARLYNAQYKNEIEQVRHLGERIGYGNMMSIASTLWAIHLEKQGIESGAFLPTIASMMKKPDAKRAIKERNSRKDFFKSLGVK